jgi:hypothetical protein
MRRPCPTGAVAPNKKMYDYITMHGRKSILKIG